MLKLPPIVGEEFDKTHAYFLKTFRDTHKNIEALTKEKQTIIEKSKGQVAFLEEGGEALNKYDLLLVVRHTDSKGEFEKSSQVSPEDVKNLNAITQKYLKWTLVPDRVSVRFARKLISKAMKELEERASDAKDPDVDNNPELEIVDKQLENAAKKTELVADFASRIGIDIKRELASEPAQ